ncbi:hypothetical protein T492DRAFT_840964 [Pavlovales sp. CCMP2436]|nr:hypothetical protein T492DRAFT_840964 [Pavlovales sp. CCMP2436]
MSQSGPLSPVAEHHAGSQPSDAGTEAAGSSQSPSNGGPPGGNGTHCGQQRLGSPDRPSAAEREETLRRSRGSPSVARRATVAWGASTVRGLSRQISIERLPEEGKRIDGLGSGGAALPTLLAWAEAAGRFTCPCPRLPLPPSPSPAPSRPCF